VGAYLNKAVKVLSGVPAILYSHPEIRDYYRKNDEKVVTAWGALSGPAHGMRIYVQTRSPERIDTWSHEKGFWHIVDTRKVDV